MIYRTMRGRTFNYVELISQFRNSSNPLYVGSVNRKNETPSKIEKEKTSVSLINYKMQDLFRGKNMKTKTEETEISTTGPRKSRKKQEEE